MQIRFLCKKPEIGWNPAILFLFLRIFFEVGQLLAEVAITQLPLRQEQKKLLFSGGE